MLMTVCGNGAKGNEVRTLCSSEIDGSPGSGSMDWIELA
jgi:hypothetical protein